MAEDHEKYEELYRELVLKELEVLAKRQEKLAELVHKLDKNHAVVVTEMKSEAVRGAKFASLVIAGAVTLVVELFKLVKDLR